LSLGVSPVSFLARFDGGEPPAENTGSSRLLPEEEIIFVHKIIDVMLQFQL
jgi:hypothetical protein